MNLLNYKKDYVIIAGPTASGKTEIAIDLAKKINGSIINSDSIQVYKTLKILSARPSSFQTNLVKHYLYGHVESDFRFSVVKWLKESKEVVEKIKKQKQIPIFVGGTGLYFYILEHGISPVPDIPEFVESETNEKLKLHGNEYIYNKIKTIDPITSQKLKINDTQRISRAWSVIVHTKKPLSYWHSQERKKFISGTPFKILINPGREEVYQKINKRFDKMMDNGALKEAKSIMEKKLDISLPIMKTLGLRQLISFLNNELSKRDAVLLAKKESRNYAKRQMTWFNNKFEPNLIIKNNSKDLLKNI